MDELRESRDQMFPNAFLSGSAWHLVGAYYALGLWMRVLSQFRSDHKKDRIKYFLK